MKNVNYLKEMIVLHVKNELNIIFIMVNVLNVMFQIVHIVMKMNVFNVMKVIY